MALTKNMFAAMTGSYNGGYLTFNDGRTVRALADRKLIYQSYVRDSGIWYFYPTVRGQSLRSAIINLTPSVREAIVK